MLVSKTDEGYLIQRDDQTSLLRVTTRRKHYPQAKKDGKVVLLDPEFQPLDRPDWRVHFCGVRLSLEEIKQIQVDIDALA